MRPINNSKLRFVKFIALILLISTPMVFALPPDPDNAALLYYQAFILYQKPDDMVQDMIADLAKGKIEPSTQTAEFIENQKAVIGLAVTAAELPKCSWGLRYSEGLSMEMPYLSQVRHLTWLIIADARTIAANGDYELAIERCLTARKFAQQMAKEPTFISLLLGISIERHTNECIQDILSSATIDLETLQRLKAQLGELDSRIKPIEFFLETEQEVMAMYITPGKIQEALPLLWFEDEAKFNKARELILSADEQFYKRNADYYNEYWAAIFSSVKMPYEQAYGSLEKAEKKVDWKDENPDAVIASQLAPATMKVYNLDVNKKTLSNAIRTAVDIYIIKAKTGQLPGVLPVGLPGDLFSGKDFEYKKTVNGFVLRCQGKDLEKGEIHEYEFKVKK
ncbi:MAG: hypothetical protein JSW23_09045 [Planctomycetota bacterium]|nr:MAG: hypothetical protein JSW23_09045 [Planctomycetota bacterium]